MVIRFKFEIQYILALDDFNGIVFQGMACAGRQKTCNVVPPNHFGPIPGVEVGQSWKYRVGVSVIKL